MGTYSPPTQTVGDVADYIKRSFGDESGAQVTDSDIIRWVNAAQKEIVASNSVLKGKSSISFEEGESTFSLNTLNILNIHSVRVNGLKVAYISFNEAESHILAADSKTLTSGQPEFWYEWAGEISLYPIPSINGTLEVFYTSLPVAVTSVSDLLSLPDTYFNRIIEFVLSQAYEMDENLEAAAIKTRSLGEALDRMSGSEDRPPTDYYPTITVLHEDL